jgi:integrase
MPGPFCGNLDFMAIRKRGSTWFIDYYFEGRRVRVAFKRKREAEAELAKRVSLKAEGRYLDVKPVCTTTLAELCVKYAGAFGQQRSFINNKRRYLENFKQSFGEDRLLSTIRFVDLESYRSALRGRVVGGHPRSDAAVNREMACLKHLLRKAVEWQLLERSAFDQGRSLMVKENNARLRFLTESEIELLLTACSAELLPIVECALLTGMRRGEILGLRWEQVRNGFIYLQRTKTNLSRQIPISKALGAVLAAQPREREFVFGRRDVKRAWAAAVKKAGLSDLRFHDLRHTFASQTLMAGGGIRDVQELLGHTTLKMTLRYAHLTQEHKRAAVELVSSLPAFRHKKAQKGKAAKLPGG